MQTEPKRKWAAEYGQAQVPLDLHIILLEMQQHSIRVATTFYQSSGYPYLFPCLAVIHRTADVARVGGGVVVCLVRGKYARLGRGKTAWRRVCKQLLKGRSGKSSKLNIHSLNRAH